MMISAEQYAPTKRWHIDTVFDVLKESGNMVRDDVVFNTIQIIRQDIILIIHNCNWCNPM